MRIFIDISHPADFHSLKNFIKTIIRKGHVVFITAKNKDVTIELLKHEQFTYHFRGKHRTTLLGKIWSILFSDVKLFCKVKSFRPTHFVSLGSPVAAHLSFLLRKPNIALEDTECAVAVQKAYLPFVNVVLTPSCFSKKLGKNQLQFSGYKELAYLHPNHFTPDIKILDRLGLSKEDPYVVLRFVSFDAMHDKHHKGFSMSMKTRMIQELRKHAKVFITSELPLPSSLKNYDLTIPVREMHHAIAFASLVMGESATMAAEAAVLGVPAIYIDDQGRGYTSELDKKYGLVFNFGKSDAEQLKAIEKGIEILSGNDNREKWQNLRNKMLVDKIDVTAFLIWFIENHPESVKTMKENPDYQLRFK